MALVRLADYRPAPYLLDRTDLTVQLAADHTEVVAQLAFRPNPTPWSTRGADAPPADPAAGLGRKASWAPTSVWSAWSCTVRSVRSDRKSVV